MSASAEDSVHLRNNAVIKQLTLVECNINQLTAVYSYPVPLAVSMQIDPLQSTSTSTFSKPFGTALAEKLRGLLAFSYEWHAEKNVSSICTEVFLHFQKFCNILQSDIQKHCDQLMDEWKGRWFFTSNCLLIVHVNNRSSPFRRYAFFHVALLLIFSVAVNPLDL